MKFFATVALLATAVAAAPSQKLFNLRTSGSSNSSHNDLYLSVGHGLASDPLNSEAVFSGASASNAAAFSFINGTIILDTEAKSPWTLDLISVEGTRKGRAQISVKPTSGSGGFSISRQGVQGPSEIWDGWLWCPTNFEAGQLFPNLHFLSKTVQEPALPEGCDRIQLNAIPTSSA
ncbi:hypothetical protein DTO013E5_6959 [Penicillium roqueforti]|uniref:Genomic scaffold, ProqFM164S01 n=1 Tax=Penicillium roqueforti (strain FM164) TaxID=1365484 RepID=W6PRN2_PENRF|nr:uncharacterized protein LCP9604111_8315 [Penicillium roqueforti]CDM26848.1 unnamed protein product [Penicillium roqueforti FM164]KAF9241706.1 hypothetical protein LCP9604111_8315 [Penicillium roqueforti]KAI1833605.1 hypothetical protein CBS147337_5644 [Penicillium roqueforti]KAI2672979.1 hypothetical protein CBS147355_7782 [Penicillium roqueforti]KAI2674257.1 hypothetical protein LCP963914a_8873 [Penicillium roqueforti]